MLQIYLCLASQIFSSFMSMSLGHLNHLVKNVFWKRMYFKNGNIYLSLLNSWITFLSVTLLQNSFLCQPVKNPIQSFIISVSFSQYLSFSLSLYLSLSHKLSYNSPNISLCFFVIVNIFFFFWVLTGLRLT